MDELIYCPECKKLGNSNKLKLYQINLFEAVYLCGIEKCKYPEGNKCILVKRTLSELGALRKKCKKKTNNEITELDKWVLDVCNETGIENNSSATDDFNIDAIFDNVTNENKDDAVNEITQELLSSFKEKNADTVDAATPIKTYSRKDKNNKNKSNNNYSVLSTSDLMEDVLGKKEASENQENIDYVDCDSDVSMPANTQQCNNKSVKDIYKNVFKTVVNYVHKANALPVPAPKLDIFDKVPAEEIDHVNTIFQDPSVTVKAYNADDLPEEYKEKIEANVQDENFKFKLVTPDVINEVLSSSMDKSYTPNSPKKPKQVECAMTRKKKLQTANRTIIVNKYPTQASTSGKKPAKPVEEYVTSDPKNGKKKIVQIRDYRFKCNIK